MIQFKLKHSKRNMHSTQIDEEIKTQKVNGQLQHQPKLWGDDEHKSENFSSNFGNAIQPLF